MFNNLSCDLVLVGVVALDRVRKLLKCHLDRDNVLFLSSRVPSRGAVAGASGGNHDEKNGNDLVVDFGLDRLVLAGSLRVSPNEVVGRSTPDFSEMRLIVSQTVRSWSIERTTSSTALRLLIIITLSSSS